MSFLPDIHLPAFIVSVLKLTMWLAILGAILVPLERLFAVRPARILRKEVAVDTAYYFINSLLPGVILGVPLALVAMAGRAALPAEWLAAVAAWPVWLKIPVAMVIAEVGFYWGHRWCHEWPVLWRFHAVHHSAEHVDFLTNTRAHPVDNVFNRLCGLIPLYAVGLSNTGAAVEGTALSVLVVVFSVGLGFFIHANLRWRLGPLEWFIATPGFHHWHHSRLDHVNHNYAPTFPWMDRIFGTLYLPRDRSPAEYGIPDPMPTTLAGQLAYPWRQEAEAPTARSAFSSPPD